MRRFFLTSFVVLFLVGLIVGTNIEAFATARLQVIHNAADPAAAMVDIYVNDALFLDDFAFRAATPFVDVPSGVNLNIGVAPPTSGGPGDVIADFDVVLEQGKTYVVMANGVLDPSGFAGNPDGRDIGFTLFARDRIRESGVWGLVKLIAFHGATDAPTVDIMVRGHCSSWRLFNDLTYGEFSSYRAVPALRYTLDVTPGNDNSTVVASFEADLRGLGNGAAVVFASGFLNPAANQGGPAFGLFAALPTGQVVALPAEVPSTARLQVIHNAADPAAAMVDIYVNDALFLDDFAFRAATPFVDVPSGVNLNIGVAPPTSGGPGDIIADFDVVLDPGKTYVAIANGVLDPSGFAGNPDGRDIGFTLFARDEISERGVFGLVKLIAFHGATDAPTVDILVRGRRWSWRLFNDLTYGEFSSYRAVPALRYTLDVTPGNDNSTVVASFEADLRGLGNGAAVVFASGFLNPAANQGGPAFGLFAALPNGQVVALPAVGGGKTLAKNDMPESQTAPTAFMLDQNYPNPFNPATEIRYELPEASHVLVEVYNAIGQKIATLVDDEEVAGYHSVTWNGAAAPSGVYFYRIVAGEFTATRKMVLQK